MHITVESFLIGTQTINSSKAKFVPEFLNKFLLLCTCCDLNSFKSVCP